jgi:hypothetical protein
MQVLLIFALICKQEGLVQFYTDLVDSYFNAQTKAPDPDADISNALLFDSEK